jgi:hypothetical protein
MNALHGLAAILGALLLDLARDNKTICIYEFGSPAGNGKRSGIPIRDIWTLQPFCVSARSIQRLKTDFSDEELTDEILSSAIKANLNNLVIDAPPEEFVPLTKIREIDDMDKLWAGSPVKPSGISPFDHDEIVIQLTLNNTSELNKIARRLEKQSPLNG